MNQDRLYLNSIEEEQNVPLISEVLKGNDSSIPFADEPIPKDVQLLIPNGVHNKLEESLTPAISVVVEINEPPASKASSVSVASSLNSLNSHHSTETKVLTNSSKTSSESHSSDINTPEIPEDVEIKSRNLRRNSISLPSGMNALDLEALRLKHQMQEQESITEEERFESRTESVVDDLASSVVLTTPEKSETSVKIQNDDSDDDWYGDGRKRKPQDRFRSRRRASIAPLPALRLNSREMIASDYDTHSIVSNQASITSVNSIASLLREKMQAFPQMIRKKKHETKDYKIKIFVIVMFFIIVFLIGYAYIGYHEKILAHSYFDKIKFKSHDRILRILDHERQEVISGNLGVTIGEDINPFVCLEEHRRKDNSVCLEWIGIARLYLNFENKDVFRCYTLHWQALIENFHPTDCFELSRDNGLWFGGSITKNKSWSVSTEDFDYVPFASGDAKVHQFGNAIKRYFINSIGIALEINNRTPLHIAVNQSANQLCLRAKNDDYTYVNHLTEYPELDYKICTTEDMRSLHMLMTQQSLWDGLKEADLHILRSLLEEPVWKIPFKDDMDSFNETAIYNYSEQVIDIGFMRLGHILVNEYWQENIGDFTVDLKRFPNLVNTIDVLHRRGFKVVFTIQPFISTDSPNFKETVQKKLLIYERSSERSIPALTRYKRASSAGVLDITNNHSVSWLLEKLQKLKNEFKVDSFFLDLGNSFNLPHYYQCRKTLDNPDMYAKLFTESLESIGFVGVSTATAVPKPPAFLSTPPINASWSGLKEVLATVLNYGVIGYPFVLPGAIGGDYHLPKSHNKMISFYSLGQPEKPEQELYIRWFQLMTFLPAMQFSHLPTEYKSEYVTEVAKELTSIRQKYVNPLLKKYLSESMNEGIPLVRPLWMLDPRDPACLLASDEFSIGEELIVAPILERDATEREVYLPQGVWKDGIDGSLRKGSRWMHNYKVPRDKIAFFVKLPDNTRF